jgi:succinate dehydrogenase / fumarate reductase, cytochrome b subunit
VSAIQIAFLGGLALALVAVALFSGAVLRSSARGGRAIRLGRFGHPPEHAETRRAAFLAHRLTGFAIFAFLCLHILDLGLYSVSHHLYDDVQQLYGTAPLRVFECGLLFAVLFHAGNGLRLVAVDLFRPSGQSSRRLLGLALAATMALGGGGSVLILAPLFQ